MGHVSFHNAGRLGNWLFEASAAMAYALDHNMPFSAPSVPAFGRNEQWNPIYCKHLIDPAFDPSKRTIVIDEKGYPFQKLPWSESWRDCNVILNGFWQSEKYFAHRRQMVLAAFGFPWELREGYVALHCRRGDYLVHKTKHPEVLAGWYFDQMEKFPGKRFFLFSDDHQYLKDTFGHRTDCTAPSDFILDHRDPRQELQDLILMSQCEGLIGSASTFAVWAGILNRNPRAKKIIPRDWICEGWQGTTAKDWADVVPTSEGWERA